MRGGVARRAVHEPDHAPSGFPPVRRSVDGGQAQVRGDQPAL